MNVNSETLGNRLKQILKRGQNNEEIIRVLQDILDILPTIWKKTGCAGDITTKRICIGECFPRRGEPGKAPTLRGYYLFVQWMISQIKAGHVFSRLLFDFAHDFGSLSYVKDFLHTSYTTSRQYTTEVSEMFKDVAQLYLANKASFGLTNEILATFGLRQCLENRLKTIVGLNSIQPRAKIKTMEWFRIIKQAESQISFAEEHHCRIADIEKIYEWTNSSIHGMTSFCCWQVWLAFDTCRFLFTVESDFNYAIQNGVEAEFDNLDGYIVSCPAHNAVRLSAKTLSVLRHALEAAIQHQVNQDQKEREIEWICPQVLLCDGDNIQVSESFTKVLKPERYSFVIRMPKMLLSKIKECLWMLIESAQR